MNHSTTAEITKRADVLPTVQTIHLMDTLIATFMVLVAIGVIYVVGLEPSEALHNSFHNVRHACAFPCH